MLTVRANDYMELTYDAAAQNRVNAVSGVQYSRSVGEKTASQVVDTVDVLYWSGKTASSVTGTPDQTLKSVSLPLLPSLENHTAFSSFATSRAALAYIETDEYITVTSPTGRSAFSAVILGKFEVTFTELSLPAGANLRVELQYSARHKAAIADGSPNELWAAQWAKEPVEGIWGFTNWNKVHLTGILNESYASLGQPKVIDMDTFRADYANYAMSYNGNLWYVCASPRELVYGPLSKGFWHMDRSLVSARLQVKKSNSDPEIGSDFLFENGYYDNAIKTELQVVNRDTVKATIIAPIAVLYDGCATRSRAYSYLRAVYNFAERITVTLHYDQVQWNGTPFEYSATSDKQAYPFRFEDSRLANANDVVAQQKWSEFYPKLIFDKYAQGKYFVELKMRAAFMLKNDLHVNSLIQIYDLNDKPLMRNGVISTFKIKRILKQFDSQGSIWIINALEE